MGKSRARNPTHRQEDSGALLLLPEALKRLCGGHARGSYRCSRTIFLFRDPPESPPNPIIFKRTSTRHKQARLPALNYSSPRAASSHLPFSSPLPFAFANIFC